MQKEKESLRLELFVMKEYILTCPDVQQDLRDHRARAKHPELVKSNSPEAVILLDKHLRQKDYRAKHTRPI